jgi:uncharacterized cupredoxin-like copper-binding protein
MSRPTARAIVLVAVAFTASAVAACGGASSAPGWTFGPPPSPGPTQSAPASVAPTQGPAASSAATISPSPTGGPVGPVPATPTPVAETPAPATPSPVAETPAPIAFTPGTRANPRVVKITADDFLNFNPGVIVAAEGETVRFEIADTGKAVHEFKIGPAADVIEDKESAPEIPDIEPGTTESLTYTFTGPGPFAFACHAPGHFEHGMMGWILLVGPDVPAVGTADHPRLVWVSMNDQLRFVPDTVAITAGETVQFVLTNAGTIDHEFQVGPGEGVAADLVDGVTVQEVDKIDPGSTRSIVYAFSGTPPFAFACHEPGHYQAGMKGTVTLVGP